MQSNETIFFLKAKELQAARAGGKEGSGFGSAEGREPGFYDGGGSAP